MNKNFMLPSATRLNKQKVKRVKGGNYSGYCAGLQEWAGTYLEEAHEE